MYAGLITLGTFFFLRLDFLFVGVALLDVFVVEVLARLPDSSLK